MPFHILPFLPMTVVAPLTPPSDINDLPSFPPTFSTPSSPTFTIYSDATLPAGPPLIPLPSSTTSPRMRPLRTFVPHLKGKGHKSKPLKDVQSESRILTNCPALHQDEWPSHVDWSPFEDLFEGDADANSLGFIKGVYGNPSFEEAGFMSSTTTQATTSPDSTPWHKSPRPLALKVFVQRESLTESNDLRDV
ncbi:hypothetical protein P7C70_g5539, partial [Phenoliferia sp. Uapishka_3]